jgi:hypothetical protein
VQAPHSPRSQPFFVPASASRSRNVSSKVARLSTRNRCSCPLTLSSTSLLAVPANRTHIPVPAVPVRRPNRGDAVHRQPGGRVPDLFCTLRGAETRFTPRGGTRGLVRRGDLGAKRDWCEPYSLEPISPLRVAVIFARIRRTLGPAAARQRHTHWRTATRPLTARGARLHLRVSAARALAPGAIPPRAAPKTRGLVARRRSRTVEPGGLREMRSRCDAVPSPVLSWN